jgi:hypothetical protein
MRVCVVHARVHGSWHQHWCGSWLFQLCTPACLLMLLPSIVTGSVARSIYMGCVLC